MNEREKFEKYMSDNGATPRTIERNGESYMLMYTANSWIIWKGCAESKQEEVKQAYDRGVKSAFEGMRAK